ncbi:MAG: DUF2911 domain-containing protein [Runella slithyformis]|nr:MAG: DUF2911 domain-containing protein [Cytophagales bacterium]TAG41384.1 MAG: DUF2911 domain-containing protein [Cytophagia bacterium]TAG52241.1 MAG: DUF2911 domain-containing protein [Runella slithyformis]TAG61890.1 MAG: DUF2911 domain-containing protein [Runella slithyformis]TAG83142.1 MAG: DUF2911 domain-containing protein [Cytophagales bacterium]
MNKTLKKVAIGVGLLVVALFVAYKVLQSQTKKASPEATVTYQKDGADISVFYCRPSKKGREIFGGLIPFGQVWRTGANEATTFTTSKALTIGGKTLPAGKYTLWTIPNKDNWKVIFNNQQYDWGVSWGGVASREATADVLEVEVPVQTLPSSQEMFTISFDAATSAMLLAWDTTGVSVPLQ